MRSIYSLKNISISFLGQILAMAIAFPARFIFINTLGKEYLGVNGLFTNIITLLSLADLGIGSAIIYSLYEPIAKGNQKMVKALMDFYKKVYIFIGILVFIIGVSILPFLNLFIDEKSNIPDLYLIFLLFVINASISYFYAYKRSIIIANQQNYIVNIIHYLSIVLLNIFQIILLISTKNYIMYLILQVFFTIVENVIVSLQANKRFPYLKQNNLNENKLNKQQLKEIFGNMRAIMLHKIGSVTVLGTDNLVISMFIGVQWVAIYSNYYLITNALTSILNQIINSITASVGNLIVQEDRKKQYQIFKNVFFVNFWLVGLFSICFWLLINPFINIWLGREYKMTNDIVFIITLNFYISCMRNSALMFKNAAGLFRPDRYKPLFEAFLNIILSILLVKSMGVKGVLIGTILSTIVTSFWIEPFIIFKYIFNKSLISYFIRYLYYTIILIAIGAITKQFCIFFDENGTLSFFLQLIICVSIPNLLLYILFRKTREFKYFSNMLIKLKK